MKRLLAYLFIVISLGINVDAKALYVSDFDEMVEEFKSYPPAADFYVYAIDENEYFTGYLNLLSKKKVTATFIHQKDIYVEQHQK